jgi:hypothetical protein
MSVNKMSTSCRDVLPRPEHEARSQDLQGDTGPMQEML